MGPIPANMRRCPQCFTVCNAGPTVNQRCKLVQRLISLLGIGLYISPEIHLISDRHSLYNIGDCLMLTIQIIGILWRQAHWLTQGTGVSGSSPAAADIFPWYTHAVTQTFQIRGIMTTETYL